jgi:hypothetical protein
MSGPIRFVSIILFTMLLVCACSRDAERSAAAGTTRSASEILKIKAMDPSDPAQAAILQWHQSLVANDFEKYSQVAVRADIEGDELRRVVFDRMRQGVPVTVLANDGTADFERLVPEEDREDLKGLRTFSLVGCLPHPGESGEIRTQAVVSARKIVGEWKVFGGSFGPPATQFAGDCPVKSN